MPSQHIQHAQHNIVAVLRCLWSQRPSGRLWATLLAALVGALGLGYALLYGVTQLPQEPLKERLLSAYERGYFDDNYPRRTKDMVMGKRYDMFAECVGISLTLHQVHSVENLLNFRYFEECMSLSAAAATGFSEPPALPYMRYTHGYLLVLRPLYTYLDIQHLRIFTISMAFLLLGLLFVVLQRHVSTVHASIVTLAFFLPCSPSMYIMATHAAQFWLVLVAAIAATCTRSKSGLFYLLGLVGLADGFVTFLAMGSLSLSLPLLCYILAAWSRKEQDEEILSTAFWSSVGWSVGFLVPWLFKLSVLYGVYDMTTAEIFSTRIAEYAPRSVAMIWLAIKNNVTTTHWEVWLPLFSVLLMRRFRLQLRMPAAFWPVLLPALIPFVWMALLPGQSGVKHSTFINLILWPTLAVLALYIIAPQRKATWRSLLTRTPSPKGQTHAA